MNKENNATDTKKTLSMPMKIFIIALCAILFMAIGAFAVMQVNASMNTDKGIGLEKATQIALQDAGYEESEISNLQTHYERDDFSSCYEVDFTAGGFKYDYEIKASDGKIIEVSKEALKGATTESQTSDGSASQSSEAPATQSQGSSSQPSTSNSQSQSASADSGNYIGTDRAKEIALQSAGINSSSATFVKAKLDRDDGIYVYDIEFISGDFEYSFEIHAVNGTILERDIESIYD